jgi:alcohol dehydrogenase class IV
MNHTLSQFGIAERDFQVIAADALDDEVLANAPVQPTERDISSMLAAALANPVGG